VYKTGAGVFCYNCPGSFEYSTTNEHSSLHRIRGSRENQTHPLMHQSWDLRQLEGSEWEELQEQNISTSSIEAPSTQIREDFTVVSDCEVDEVVNEANVTLVATTTESSNSCLSFNINLLGFKRTSTSSWSSVTHKRFEDTWANKEAIDSAVYHLENLSSDLKKSSRKCLGSMQIKVCAIDMLSIDINGP